MSTPWADIAESLRVELADYGGLLHLFEAQQRGLFARNADLVLELSGEIERQAELLGVNRGQRERLVAEFALAAGLPANSTLRSLLPRFDAVARPLLEALIDEVNCLLHRVRRTSRHNPTLLASVVQTHRETLQQLRPQAFPRTYAPSGRVAVNSAELTSTMRATG